MLGIKRYALSEAQWSRIALPVPGKMADLGRMGANTTCHNRMSEGVALRRTLARSAGRIRQAEDGAPALQPLVACRHVGTDVRGADNGPRQPVSDDRH